MKSIKSPRGFKRLLAVAASLAVATAGLIPAFTSAAGPNLIANPGMETAAGAQPASWIKNNWGSNTAVFTYENTGRSGNRSATVKVSNYKSGDAKWSFAPVNVTPNTKYTFSNWYKSTAVSGIDAVVTTTSNTTQYVWMGTAATSSAWKQQSFSFTAPANAKQVTFYHYLEANGSLTTDDFSLTADDGTPTPTPTPTPPTVSLASPANNSTVSGTQTVTANATDAQGIKNVQFKLDGVNLGAADTTAPYSVSWDTKTATNGSHTLTAVATNTSDLTTTSSVVTVNVSNTVTVPAPTIAITSPANGATVSGAAVKIAANATDAQGIKSVQFKLDGVNLGDVETTAPFDLDWDTRSTINGSHTLTAVVTNTSNVTATSAPVTVTVNNVTTPTPTPSPSNLIANPSVETANGTQPAGWVQNSWGNNTNSLTYETNGQDGNRSLKATINTYSSGDAKWYFTPINVTAGTTYNYSEYYKSNVDTEVDAMVTMNDGSVQYYWMGTLPASSNWQKANLQFTAPANTKTLTIFHVISKVGYVQTDNFSLSAYTPTKLSRGLVSLTFDDGWRSIYSNGLPILEKYGFKSTQYLNSEPVIGGYPDYMTYAQIKEFYAKGHELGWHTRTHADITKLTSAQLATELSIPTAFLTGLGLPASTFQHFASPFGAYNATSVAQVRQTYASHRSTDVGYNTKDNLDVNNIKVQNITINTSAADVKAWVDKALADGSWLVIVYHEVGASNEDPTYSTTPALFDAHLNAIKQSGVTVKTFGQALAEVRSQL